jgi:tripeptidyl-peptidase-1
MIGKMYNVQIGGFSHGVSGTSASAPVVAGMITLANAARLTAGKSSLGFLNPALYGNGAAVANDITSGRNNCCAGQNIYNVVCCPHGYTAFKGWDPVTGFGSLNYKRFSGVFGA